MLSEKNIEIQAVKSVKWVVFPSVISKIYQPIITVVLARLLAPYEFGLLAFAAIIISAISLFQDLGMGAALIQKKDQVRQAANIVFFTNCFLGLIWYGAIFVSAPYVALFFNNKEIIPILRVMGLSFLISPFGSVQSTLLTKEFHFKKIFFLQLIPTFVPGLVSIILAFCGFGVWALVYGSLISSVSSTIVIWLTIPWRPNWKYDAKLAKKLISFGSLVTFEGILNWGVNTIDDVLVGKWLGSAKLGIYTLGFSLAIWPATNITNPVLNIVYPTFSKLQDDRERLKKIYLQIIKNTSLITFPLGTGIMITADKFIPFLFGEKWLATIPVIQVIAIYGVFMSIGSIMPQLYKALGRPDIYLKYVLVRSIFTIPVYIYIVPHGLIALSFAHLILTCCFFPINFYIGMRILRISFSDVFNAFWVSAGGSVGIVILYGVIKAFLPFIFQLSNGGTLVIIVSLSLIVYILSLYFISKSTFEEVRKLLKMIIAK